MWTSATREKYNRHALRYQIDVTDQEWLVLEPLLPKPKTRGRRWSWPLREIVNAIFYVMRSGCAWRLLPADFHPGARSIASSRPGVTAASSRGSIMPSSSWIVSASDARPVLPPQSSTAKVSRPRKPVACAAMMQARRSTSASATSSSTPTDERSCSNRIPRAFRIATAARCSALPVPCIRSSRASSPIAVTTHEQIANATNIVVEIVRKIAGQVGFVVLPRRWVVERFFAWITKTEGLRKISKRQSTRPEPSSTPPQSCSSLAVSPGKPEFRNRLSG